MNVELTLGLKDLPGMLVAALKPISDKGGNIKGIMHSRGARDTVQVVVTLSVKDQSTLANIIKALKASKTSVRKVRCEGRKYYTKKNMSLLLIGHVIDTDIQDTIDRLNSMGLVSDVDVRMADPDDRSSVLMKIEVDEKKESELKTIIGDICNKKNLIMIPEI
ncbi:ACT domain-containing protein [Candidatus Altiarchaeota archaeon]